MHILVSTPIYGGLVTDGYFKSVLNTITEASRRGIPISFQTIGDSLVTRGRNNLVSYFLNNPHFTHLFWIDADISWEPDQFFRLIDIDRDVTAAVYPFKTYFFERAIGQTTPEQVEKSMLRYVVNMVNPDRGVPVDGFVEVLDAATGFMCIKRGVFDQLMTEYPELEYASDMLGVDTWDNHWLFFDTMVDGKRYLSEDYAFCRRWQRMGGKIWMDVYSKLTHTGAHSFRGDFLGSMGAYSG